MTAKQDRHNQRIWNICALSEAWGLAVTCEKKTTRNGSNTTCTISVSEDVDNKTTTIFSATSRGTTPEEAQQHAVKETERYLSHKKPAAEVEADLASITPEARESARAKIGLILA